MRAKGGEVWAMMGVQGMGLDQVWKPPEERMFQLRPRGGAGLPLG